MQPQFEVLVCSLPLKSWLWYVLVCKHALVAVCDTYVAVWGLICSSWRYWTLCRTLQYQSPQWTHGAFFLGGVLKKALPQHLVLFMMNKNFFEEEDHYRTSTLTCCTSWSFNRSSARSTMEPPATSILLGPTNRLSYALAWTAGAQTCRARPEGESRDLCRRKRLPVSCQHFATMMSLDEDMFYHRFNQANIWNRKVHDGDWSYQVFL